jgi:Rod binding domain-containing protein
MLLKQMHKSTMKGGLLQEKSESATYREMFDDAVASEIGKSGSFGIADTLYRELSKRFDAAKATPEGTNAPEGITPSPATGTSPILPTNVPVSPLPITLSIPKTTGVKP